MKANFKEVSEEEFDLYVKSYPNKLVWDYTGICEPPQGSYNDFTLGKWPQSMIAKVSIMDGSEYYNGQFSKYFIKE